MTPNSVLTRKWARLWKAKAHYWRKRHNMLYRSWRASEEAELDHGVSPATVKADLAAQVAALAAERDAAAQAQLERDCAIICEECHDPENTEVTVRQGPAELIDGVWRHRRFAKADNFELGAERCRARAFRQAHRLWRAALAAAPQVVKKERKKMSEPIPTSKDEQELAASDNALLRVQLAEAYAALTFHGDAHHALQEQVAALTEKLVAAEKERDEFHYALDAINDRAGFAAKQTQAQVDALTSERDEWRSASDAWKKVARRWRKTARYAEEDRAAPQAAPVVKDTGE